MDDVSKILTEREKQALLEDLRSELCAPIDVIVGYSEILAEELSKIKNIEVRTADLKKIIEGGKAIQLQVDEAFELASVFSKQKNFDIAEFIRNLRHTLLTPLNSIIGYSELLFEEGFAQYGVQPQEDLMKIHEAATIFISYINKISAFAQTQFEGGDLLSQFKLLSTVVHNVVTSIPPLDQKVDIQPSKQGAILIVDDNKMELDLLERRVEYFGYTAIVCNHGKKVLDILRSGHVDLILLQIMMAEVSGFEVLKQIKKTEEFKHLPIIVISPLKELDAVVRCFELGADDYLSKPFHSVIFRARINNCIEKKKLIDLEKKYFLEMKKEKEKTEELLLNILPSAVVERMKLGENFIADRVKEVSILFVDIVNFTEMTEKIGAQELISILNQVFSLIDHLIDKNQVEKIKTIGDSYMAAAGVPIPNKHHAEAIANVALDILKAVERLNSSTGYNLHVRLGVHSGPVVSGIIGVKKFNFDLWGRTVNLASRMESEGVPDKIQVSDKTYELLKDKFEFEKRGKINVKGVGEIDTYFLVGRKKCATSLEDTN